MTRFLRARGLGLVPLLAALVAGAVILAGCGSPPAPEQRRSEVTEETAQVPEEAAPEESTAVELAPPESGLSEAPSAQAEPPPAEAPPSEPAAPEAPPAEPAAEPSVPVAAIAAAAVAVDWVGSSQKWVPIFSLETEGVYLGAAQVAGSSSQVAKVKGVAELRLKFKDIGRIYAYIPVSTISLTKLDRVQGVSVWAIGDLQLAEF